MWRAWSGLGFCLCLHEFRVLCVESFWFLLDTLWLTLDDDDVGSHQSFVHSCNASRSSLTPRHLHRLVVPVSHVTWGTLLCTLYPQFTYFMSTSFEISPPPPPLFLTYTLHAHRYATLGDAFPRSKVALGEASRNVSGSHSCRKSI